MVKQEQNSKNNRNSKKKQELNEGYTPSLHVIPPSPQGNKNILYKPIAVTNIRSAKKLLSKLIKGFQKKEIDDRNAKTLAYLIQVYVQVIKESEFDQRIKDLEGKLDEY